MIQYLYFEPFMENRTQDNHHTNIVVLFYELEAGQIRTG